uniref:non-specific protein-tyrosine kinase n=1 Tax=Monosiga ovata TaxID=81526 RepID=B3XVW0_9EUKA|nr:protein tyrosine kinase [Monosiga ovata]
MADYRTGSQPMYAVSDTGTPAYAPPSLAPSDGVGALSIQTATSQYREPEPALYRVDKGDLHPKKGVKLCECCQERKFGMFNGKSNCEACGQVVCGKCTTRRHPLHKELKICKHCYSRGMAMSYHMQDMGWYHGPVSRSATEERLLAAGALPGDYLVRESQGLDGFLALSVRGEESLITHYLINIYRDCFYVGTARHVPSEQDELFPSIERMLESMEVIRLCRLRRAVIVEPPDNEVCPRCKFVNPSVDTLFCGGCGTRLNSTQAQRKLYYDLGIAMRDPNFTHASIDNPGYQQTPTKDPNYMVVNMNKSPEGSYSTSGSPPPPTHLYSVGDVKPSTPATYIYGADATPQNTYMYGVQEVASPGVYIAGQDLQEEANMADGQEGFVYRELDRSKLRFTTPLGYGFFGIVKRATLTNPDGSTTTVAGKQLKDTASPAEEDAFLNEIHKVSQLSHPNVVRSYGAITRSKPMFLIMELCSEGSLHDMLKANDKRLDQRTSITLLKDFALGLEYIAGLNIVHRDVAARNCLVTVNPDGKLVAKVSDMGLARDVVETYYATSKGGDLARRWLSPEAMLYSRFSESSDVWAFGLTVFETFQHHPGSLPFYFLVKLTDLASTFESVKDTANSVVELCKDLERTCPGEIHELITACLSHSHHDRPRFAEIAVRLTDALDGSKRWNFPRSNLKLVNELGSGAYGKVYRYEAIGLGPASISVAAKTCTDEANQSRFLQEIELMKSLRHPHIVQMLAACTSDGPPLMILEFMAEGSLDHFLRRPKVQLTTTELQSILFQAATALAYITSRQLVHRDVSARNCLVSMPLNVKLADFGLARETEESLYEQSTNTNIPVRWTAPECFRTRQFNEASDVFGFGTLAWEVYTYPWDRKKPYKHTVPLIELSDAQFIGKLRSGFLPPLIPLAPSNFLTPVIKETISKCRLDRAADRPTFEQLVQQLSLFKTT